MSAKRAERRDSKRADAAAPAGEPGALNYASPADAAGGGEPTLPTVDRVLFCALAGAFAARPLLSESFTPLELSFLSPVAGGLGPTTAATAWLDTIMLALAAALAWRTRLVCRGPVLIGWILLLASVVVSTLAAGNPRPALTAGANMLVMLAAAAALWGATRHRWMTHLLLAAAIGTGAVSAVKCALQWSYEFNDTLENWVMQEKPRLAALGFDVTDPQIEDFERRLRSAEAYGYGNHPNVTAATLAPPLLLAAALVAGLGRRGLGLASGPWWAAALCAAALAGGLLFAIKLTGSTGALVGVAAGGMVILAYRFAPDWWDRAPGRLGTLVLAAYVLLMAGGAAWGLSGQRWPHVSLEFRWAYWTAAARAWPEFAWTGCGRENFIVPYMRHKAAEYTEQVRNPHGLWVALPVELGPLGLAAGLLLTVVPVWRLLRPGWRAGRAGASTGGELQAAALSDDGAGATAGVRPALASEILPLVMSTLIFQAYFSGTPFDAPGVGIVWGQEVALAYLIALLVSLKAVETCAGAPGGWRFMAIGCGAALVATLVHNLIDFSLFTPGGLAAILLPVVAGWSLLSPAGALERAGGGEVRAGGGWRARVAPIGLTLLTLAHVAAVSWPVGQSTRLLAEMRSAIRSADGLPAATKLAEGAMRADPLDADTPRTATQAVLAFALDPRISVEQQLERLQLAARFAGLARDRNAAAPSGWRLLARIDEARAERLDAEGDNAEAQAARAAAAEMWDEAALREPTDERTHLSAGLAWGRRWGDTDASEDAKRACAHLKRAEEIDALRPSEAAAKLRAGELEQIAQARSELSAGGMGCE